MTTPQTMFAVKETSKDGDMFIGVWFYKQNAQEYCEGMMDACNRTFIVVKVEVREVEG